MVGADAALGYTDYLAPGGDWGAGVTTWMAKQHVEGLAAIHLNLRYCFHLRSRANRTRRENDHRSIGRVQWTKDGLLKIQSTRPQDHRYALATRLPASGWIYEKLGEWTEQQLRTGAGNLARRDARQYLALLAHQHGRVLRAPLL